MNLQPIPSCPGYYASDEGHIYSKRNFNRWQTLSDELKPLKSQDNGKGYLGVTICVNSVRSYRKVHRLVFEAFNSISDTLQVHHIDGDRSNNSLDNLEGLTSRAHLDKHHSRENRIAKAIQLLTEEGYTITKG